MLPAQEQVYTALVVDKGKVQGHGRQEPGKLLHDLGQKIQAGADRKAEVQRFRVARMHIPSVFNGGLQFFLNGVQTDTELFSGRGQDRAFRVTLKHRESDLRFQALDLLSQRRLADKKIFRSFPEIQGI